MPRPFFYGNIGKGFLRKPSVLPKTGRRSSEALFLRPWSLCFDVKPGAIAYRVQPKG